MNNENSKLTPKQNLIVHRYLATIPNFVICIDITDLKEYGQLFAMMDLAARQIAGHVYTQETITLDNILEGLQTIIEDRAHLPKINIIHSDRESFFKNPHFYKFLDDNNIQGSRGSAEARSNQVMERTFRTLKGRIRKIMDITWSQKKGKEDPLATLKPKALEEMDQIVRQAITEYNNAPHKALCKLTPNNMEDTMFEFLKNKQSQHTVFEQTLDPKNSPQLFTINSDGQHVKLEPDSDNFLEIKQLKQAIPALVARNDQERLKAERFIENLAKQFLQKNNIHQFLDDFKNETLLSFTYLANQNQKLYEQNKRLEESLQFVEKELREQKELRNIKEARRQKRLQTQTQPQREYVSFETLKKLLEYPPLNKKSYTSFRKRAAILLLYTTGLRISNLLTWKVKDLVQFLDKKNVTIDLIKKGASQHRIVLAPKRALLLKQNQQALLFITTQKEENDPVFTAQNNPTSPLSRVTFDTEINSVLKAFSLKEDTHLRSHSFRASFVTDLLRTNPLQTVAKIVGHKDIGTTAEYDRAVITLPQLTQIMKALDENEKELVKVEKKTVKATRKKAKQ